MPLHQLITVALAFLFMIGWIIVVYVRRIKDLKDAIDTNSKMILKSRCIEEGKYEVGGVIFYADTHAEALNKYRRAHKEAK